MRAVEKQGIRDDLLLIIALYSTRDTEYLDMLEGENRNAQLYICV